MNNGAEGLAGGAALGAGTHGASQGGDGGAGGVDLGRDRFALGGEGRAGGGAERRVQGGAILRRIDHLAREQSRARSLEAAGADEIESAIQVGRRPGLLRQVEEEFGRLER